MADAKQVARLQASIFEENDCSAWNQWRHDNPEIQINLCDTDFNEAKLTNIDLHAARLSRIHLRSAHLQHACFNDACLVDGDFRSVDLSNADCRNVDLSGANLSKATIRGACFRKGDLTSVNLSNANLSKSDLSDAILTEADLSGAHLMKADLRSAHLYQADLTHANLAGAHFGQADLTGANLTAATLTSANLTNARVGWTTFSNSDICHVVGLDTVQHSGPSHIATDVFDKSGGDIPDIFLRGCGLSDELISFVHSIAGAIQYYSVFISYNHQDEAFATRLYNDLQANNVRCWKYTEDMRIGDKIHAQVDEAIRLHDKLLVIFSQQSVQSDWVAGEVESALAKEDREGKQVLFPVTIDSTVKMTHLGWAAAIRRSRNIDDFTGWKSLERYQPKFERLLRDLKADYC